MLYYICHPTVISVIHRSLSDNIQCRGKYILQSSEQQNEKQYKQKKQKLDELEIVYFRDNK